MSASDALLQWLPPAASSAAHRYDALMIAWAAISIAVTAAIFVAIAWMLVRYRAGSSVDRAHPPTGNAWLESAWIAIPLAIFLAMGAWGAVEFGALYGHPADAVPVYVVAKQWMWTLQHGNGRREIGELHVPVGRPVRMIMTSQDVIHSFFVPAFRIKQDVLPGRYTSIVFTPTEAGTYRLFCAEYCGTHHATMEGRVIAMDAPDYAAWLDHGPDAPGLASRGFDLFRRYGCSGCHVSGPSRAAMPAPDLTGLYGRVVRLADGRSVVADENYIRDSILVPDRDVVAGYEPRMPSYAGQVGEEDLAAIVHYIRTMEPR